MPLIKYEDHKFRKSTLITIKMANAIIAEYQAQGFDLTLRQLYYQFVARDLLPENTATEYKKLGETINKARLAGLIDWNAIVDRTRNLRALPSWDSASQIVESCAAQFRSDRWADQPYRPEVWIEKEALAGVFAGVCNDLQVPYFSCKGYTSQSEMWAAGQRLLSYFNTGHRPVIFHFGDHDPSGIDMTRDIQDRLALFTRLDVQVERLALNFDQVQEYNPPPNFAKETDSRHKVYLERFGDESWELDALDPTTLAGLIREQIEAIRDDEAWDEATARDREARRALGLVAAKWSDVKTYVEKSDA